MEELPLENRKDVFVPVSEDSGLSTEIIKEGEMLGIDFVKKQTALNILNKSYVEKGLTRDNRFAFVELEKEEAEKSYEILPIDTESIFQSITCNNTNF